MTSPQGNPARREPLLWLQLLGLAALPLEAAALLLLLAGADPGPLPALELLFCWSLGAAGPALLFWRLPPDLWSLLLVQVPLKGRRPDQLRLSALQGALPVQLLAAAGAPLLVPLLWWSDRTAGLAWAWSPLLDSPRLVVLLVAAALLALMLWQWQQSVQALWLLTRPAAQVARTLPLPLAEAANKRRSKITITHSAPFPNVDVLRLHVFAGYIALDAIRLRINLLLHLLNHIPEAHALPLRAVE